jgi:ADP-heptose:LPS heptosyltransferase
MATTLVIRLSSLGDVAILVPVLYSAAIKNPDDHFFLLTKKPLQPLFINKPPNLEIFPVHTKERHKGLLGLIKLIGDVNIAIRRLSNDSTRTVNVADVHKVFRSKLIDLYFHLKGDKVAVINKGKKEKRMLTQKNKKRLLPLKSSLERYRKVFEDLGYDASPNFTSLFDFKDSKTERRIGIAPFAKHPGKIYPFEQMEKVIRLLGEKPCARIFLFGGKEECKRLEEWAKKYPHVESVAGHLSFPDELLLINGMDVMLSMDSANMHLASLVNTPVVSIWGATHPYAGFYGFNQDWENAVQVDMECRPCSVYGNKPCFRGDYACLKQISPEMIVEKINAIQKNENCYPF